MECAPNTTEVISLSLPDNNLISLKKEFGVPIVLANLTSLQILNLANNNFQGGFETAFNSLTELRSLDLSRAGLSVSDLSGLTNLRYLALRGVIFGQNIDFLRNLTKLEYLDLSRDFTERTSVTTEPIGALHALRFLQLAGNGLSNLASFAGLTELEFLDLSNTQLDGGWPGYEGTEALSHMTRLQYLDLGVSTPPTPNPQSNILSPILGLSQLSNLRLAGVNLTCSLPMNFFSSLTNLTNLDLSFTNLTGEIPANIHLAPLLTQILLQGNTLTGNIPPTICSLQHLVGLNATHNNLTGHLPKDLGNLSQLQKLHLGKNLLSGSIPESIGALTNLTIIELQSNRLTGPIPDMRHLLNLTVLNLAGNFLDGPLPEGLGPVIRAGLTYLDLSNNKITGLIPDLFGEHTLNHLVPCYPLL
mgnify:CR=1 FL=1